MRSVTVAVVATLSLMTMTNAGSAAPAVPNLGVEQGAAIVQIAGGCGRGWHPNRWGRCVPNHYSYYRPYLRPYAPYYGDGHEPWNRPTPGDYGAADYLNRQQLGRPWGY
jgi:hypothetical protein